MFENQVELEKVVFGEHLKELRESANLKQKDLSEVLGIKQNSLSSYENGKRFPEMMTLLKIAKYFNVSIDSLVYEVDQDKERVINKGKNLILELDKGTDVEGVIEKFNLVVDGEELDFEAKKRILEQIKFEYLKKNNVI